METRPPLQPLNANILRAPATDEHEAPKRKRTRKGVRHGDRTISSFVHLYCEGDPIVTTICKAAKKDDPPLIFGWRNVRAFVESIPHVNNLPAPFPLPQNPTEDQFKVALLHFVRATGSSLPLSTFVLPCTIHEITQVCGNLARLE
jgi:hypothetical protein